MKRREKTMESMTAPDRRTEIERRFLVPLDVAIGRASDTPSARIEQCYLQGTDEWQVRSRRILENGEESYLLTMKRRIGHGEDHEIELPGTREAHEQMTMSGAVIVKTRTRHALSCGNVLELDIYEDPLLLPGYAVAEVELQSIDAHVELPGWIGEEITGDAGTSNHARFLSLIERSRH